VAAEAPKAEAEAPPVEAAPAAEEPAPVEEPEETPDAKIARLEAEVAEFKKAPPTPAPTPEPVEAKPEPKAPEQPAAPVEPQWYRPTDEEAATLKRHEEQWPEISTAEALRTKVAVYNAVQYVFTKMGEVYGPVLRRFNDTADAIEEQLTLGALRSEHEDYDTIYGKVVAWVPTLPVAFRQGAERVMKEGTPEEVADLISTYKQSIAAPPSAAAAPAAKRTPELSAPAKKAAAALTVVGSKRSTPVTAIDANDFDGAWADAINQR
jgi:hypothetical protein